ncbi:MAG: C4-type zinc ribbon domain-containing protein [Deltaproteobacteria bacterium]|nr:C4-type zinc ribbon domain-containing protein [Deltaproteobacteria bacterium]
MKEALLALIGLQETDDQERLERRLLSLTAAELAAAQEALARSEGEMTELRGLQGAEEARHRELEAEVADLSAKKLKNGDRQMAVKTDGEFAALKKEAEYLAKKINDLEDETLALLDRLDQRRDLIADRAALAAEAGAACAALAAKAEDGEKAGRAALEALAARRADLARTIGPILLKQYEETARDRGGVAVTAAAEGLCLACRLSFPPQFYNELQRNEKISVCPNCDRLIYWRDHPDFKAPGHSPGPMTAGP